MDYNIILIVVSPPLLFLIVLLRGFPEKPAIEIENREETCETSFERGRTGAKFPVHKLPVLKARTFGQRASARNFRLLGVSRIWPSSYFDSF